MKINIFDVVELKNGNKAIILGINNDEYKVDVTDKNGKPLGIMEISSSDISTVIYSKKKNM